MANPHKSATRVHTDRPCSSVPSHRPHTPSPSTACDLYIVAKVAAPAIEITSITIQSFAVPRTPRAGSPATPPSHSWEEAIVADSLCQNSEVAIRVRRPQVFKNYGIGQGSIPCANFAIWLKSLALVAITDWIDRK